jgi:hypothetical protein
MHAVSGRLEKLFEVKKEANVRKRLIRCSVQKRKNPGSAGVCVELRFLAKSSSCGDRIRTCDLEVMSLASYRAAPPRVVFPSRVNPLARLNYIGWLREVQQLYS